MKVRPASSDVRSDIIDGSKRIAQILSADPQSAVLLAVGVISLIVMIVQAPADVRQLYRDADTAVAFVLPQLAGHSPHGAVIDLGNHNWYEAWWFERATIGLPDHFLIWEVAPFVVYLLGIAAVCWGVGLALGYRAALYTAVALLVVGNQMRQVVFEPDVRVGLLVHMGLACVALVAVWGRACAGRLSGRWLLGVGAALTLFTAAGGTDQLLMIDGVAPFVLAAWLWWWRNGSREARSVALFATAVGLSSLIGEVLLTTVMVRAGVSSSLNLNSFQFVPAAALVTDVENTIVAWVSFADGNFFGTPVNKASILVFLLGTLSLLGLAVGVNLTLRTSRRWWSDRAITKARCEVGTRDLFLGFWMLVLIMTFASFMLTTASAYADSRYLLGSWIAVAVLLGAAVATRHGHTVLVVCLAVFSVVMIRDDVTFGIPSPGVAYSPPSVTRIKRFVLSEGASVGYAAYDYSHNFTWATRFQVKVFPVWPCPLRPGQACRRALSSDSAWFVPRADTRTFLITGAATAITAPPADFGAPIAKASFGQLTVFVYGHDVARQILQY